MTRLDDDIQLIYSTVEPIIGLKPWTVFRQFGTYLYFDFGGVIPTEHGETGQWRLVVLDCAWRLQTTDYVLTSCWDIHPVMDPIIERLEERTVTAITVSKPSLDTRIVFDNEIELVLFSTHTEDSSSNWLFFTPDYQTLRVGPGQKVVCRLGSWFSHPILKLPEPISEQSIQDLKMLLDTLSGNTVKQITHDTLENLVIVFENEDTQERWELMPLNCRWRLETTTKFIAGAGDEETGFNSLVKRLESRKLQSIEVTRPFFETVLVFKGQLKLRLFTYLKQKAIHYTVTFPDGRYLKVGPDTSWSIKQRMTKSRKAKTE